MQKGLTLLVHIFIMDSRCRHQYELHFRASDAQRGLGMKVLGVLGPGPKGFGFAGLGFLEVLWLNSRGSRLEA